MRASISMHHVQLPLRTPMKSAKGLVTVRDTIIIRMVSEEGHVGYGECPAFLTPFYTGETIRNAWMFLNEVINIGARDIITMINGALSDSGAPYARMMMSMSRCALVNAFDGITENMAGNPLSTVANYAEAEIWPDPLAVVAPSAGVPLSLGLVLSDYPEKMLLPKIEAGIADGCQRFKLKISPETGLSKVKAIRDAFPDLRLAVDANGSFSPVAAHIQMLQDMDALQLDFIEEPFSCESWSELEGMQEVIRTPLCYDESIQSMGDVLDMHRHGAGSMINVKACKFGGLYRTMHVLSLAQSLGVQYMYGNMIESGIGKIQQAQIASLIPSTVIGDLSDSSRYFECDLIEPDIHFVDGRYVVPQGPGIGAVVREDMLEKYTVRKNEWITDIPYVQRKMVKENHGKFN